MTNPTPSWTVFYNINSYECDGYIGTGWEFFDEQACALACYNRHHEQGNVPTMRPFHEATDRSRMGAIHQTGAKQ